MSSPPIDVELLSKRDEFLMGATPFKGVARSTLGLRPWASNVMREVIEEHGAMTVGLAAEAFVTKLVVKEPRRVWLESCA